MNQDEITFERLPEVMAYLIQEMTQLRKLLEEIKRPTLSKRIPIDIDEACKIIKKAKPTVYSFVRKGLIPCYKNGKKLYFFEDELLDWLAKGKKKTVEEMTNEIFASNSGHIRTRKNK